MRALFIKRLPDGSAAFVPSPVSDSAVTSGSGIQPGVASPVVQDGFWFVLFTSVQHFFFFFGRGRGRGVAMTSSEGSPTPSTVFHWFYWQKNWGIIVLVILESLKTDFFAFHTTFTNVHFLLHFCLHFLFGHMGTRCACISLRCRVEHCTLTKRVNGDNQCIGRGRSYKLNSK